MLTGVLGRKIGMTQVFSAQEKVVPVTVIDISHWYVTGIKTKERDGYEAVQVACLRPRYQEKAFDLGWLKDLTTYFSAIREIEKSDLAAEINVGQPIDFATILLTGDSVDVFGTTKGHGFQGVVKRHNFTGGRASHGPRFGRIPGSVSHMRRQGRVIKGKRLPGHMGDANRVMKNLEVIRIEPEAKLLLVKGSVPGATGSLVFVQKV